MSNQSPIVLAPRPLRSLAPRRDPAEPSEALDEFLSILTPAFLRGPRAFAPAPRPSPLAVDPRWALGSAAILASPVSRLHTRNPFQRTLDAPPNVPLPPLTPAAVPLPSPTPDELADAL